MKRRKSVIEIEQNNKAVDALDALDNLMQRITEATNTIDPTHLTKQGPKK